ncbi:Minor allergen Alt a 7 [Symbiodinium microadriaticum]|uniref:Minor allergen Alt a 7 n=1 Tax=Symbiodinium microadriaticum TaxID=2951 RepID=A0A1Q9EJU8_SYMMI|nr:Minor allergen Alt a 7 [Symbiodinium microadriaticum]
MDLARSCFVSLEPVGAKEAASAEPRWTSFPALWAKGRATFEERALLLCSLLLGYSLDAWVCLGTDDKGLAHAWVLVRDRADASTPAQVTLWDPRNAQRIKADDPRYLRSFSSVDTVFNHQRILVCHEEELQHVCYDFSDPRSWLAAPVDQEAPVVGAEVAIQKGLPPMKKATGPSVAIVYYSTYGHVKVMADEIKKGLESTGVSVDLFQVPETLPPSALQAMGAPEKPADVMLLERAFLSELPKYDGFMFGMPTRFGMMASQMKAFFDGTGSLWQNGALAGKLGATFVSTGTQQGGQETTHFTAVTQLVHHGMCYVPLGYQAGGEGQFDLSEIHGGSPWGASTLAGPDGSRQPSALELKIAKKQGEVFGTAVKRTTAPAASKKGKVCIVYYSMYGHVKKLADEIAASMKEEGVSVDMFQAPELLGADVLKKMGAPAKPSDTVMDHAKVQQLADYDGLLFGIPTRFGSASAQMKAFFDNTGSLWQSGALAGKLTGSFCSTGTLNGGQESTHMTTMTNMVHHGMIYVPLGYQAGGDGQFDMTEIHGGSPWGASTYAGADGSRQASAMELKIARRQGKVFASKVKQMMK